MRARLLVLAAAVLFSTGGAAIKATSLTGWQVACLRSAVAAVTLFLALPRSRRPPTRAMLLVGVAYAATLILFVQSSKLTTSANAIFLQDTAPLYILLVSPFVLGEKVRRSDAWFMIALAAGLAAFFVGQDAPQSTASHPLAGNLAAVASGMTWAATIIGLRWLGTRAGDPYATQPTLVAGNAIACVATLPMALPVTLSGTDAVLILFLGVFQIGLAYACLSAGMAGVPALESSLLLLLEPVLNPIWTWLVHGEAPNNWALLGGAIILAATMARTWAGTKEMGSG
jgi:drug/metabolite transporter (DMT)-like permease